MRPPRPKPPEDDDATVVVPPPGSRPSRPRWPWLVGGLAVPAQPLEDQAQVAMRLREVRRQAQRCPGTAGRPFQLSQGAINLGQVSMVAGHVGPQRCRLAITLLRLGE